MEKDFDGWSRKKRRIHDERTTIFCHEREVWWCTLGVNIGFEEDGSGKAHRRPVLVFKNMSPQTALVIPLTTSLSVHSMRFKLGVIGDKKASAVLSQMRVIDTKRLTEKIENIDQVIFEKMRKTIKGML
jgi:mRNA-degrading endonuclease toxin of MazEF toxin-antitoxin module